MQQSTFTEAQITSALRQAETGTPVAEVCRKLGVSEQTVYRWKRQCAGMGIAALRRLRQREEENRKLTQLVADLTLDKHMLQEAIRKELSDLSRAGSWCSVCGWGSRSASDGPAACCQATAPPTGTGASRTIRRPSGCGDGSSQRSGCGMAIVASTSCSSARAGRSITSGSTGDTAGRGAPFVSSIGKSARAPCAW